MKNKIKTLGNNLLGVAAAGMITLAASAQDSNAPLRLRNESKPTVSNLYANTGFYSQYVGILGFTGSEGPVIQSDVGASIEKFALNAWSNYDLENGINEVDLSIERAFTPEKHVRITPGFTYYTFPNTSSRDAYVPSLRFNSQNIPLDLRLNIYKAFGEGSNEGVFIQLGVGKNIPLTKGITLGIEGRVNYNHNFFAKGEGIQSVAADIGITFNVEGYSVTPMIRLQNTLETMGGQFKDEVMGGIKIGRRF